MKTLKDINSDLVEVFEALKTGRIDIKLAKELNNTTGKMAQIAKVQLVYHGMRSEVPESEFLSLGEMKKIGAPIDEKVIEPVKVERKRIAARLTLVSKGV